MNASRLARVPSLTVSLNERFLLEIARFSMKSYDYPYNRAVIDGDL